MNNGPREFHSQRCRERCLAAFAEIQKALKAFSLKRRWHRSTVITWHPPVCPDCSQTLIQEVRDHKGRKAGRYWVCRNCRFHRRPVRDAVCPWCNRQMNFSTGRDGAWEGVHIWWCQSCRYPSSRRIHIHKVGAYEEPLGNRPVRPGSMFNVRKDSAK